LTTGSIDERRKKTLSTPFFPRFLRLFRFFFSQSLSPLSFAFNFYLLQQWIKESNRPQACDQRKHYQFLFGSILKQPYKRVELNKLQKHDFICF